MKVFFTNILLEEKIKCAPKDLTVINIQIWFTKIIWKMSLRLGANLSLHSREHKNSFIKHLNNSFYSEITAKFLF